MGGIARRRTTRRADWRWLALVNGMDLGKAAWYRSHGARRREDDVYGGCLSWLALDVRRWLCPAVQTLPSIVAAPLVWALPSCKVLILLFRSRSRRAISRGI